MKKPLVKIFAVVCLIVMAATFTAQGAQPAKPVKLSIISPDLGRIVREDNPVVKEIEKRTNTKLEITLVPRTEFLNKFNVLVASRSVPDISRLDVTANGYDFFQYIPQKAFRDLTGYINKYGVSIKNKKLISQEIWDLVKVDKKIYGIPAPNVTGKFNHVVRQDWLDNLGLKTPTNLDELAEMLQKFTFNDPDKNGEDDTYGYSFSEGITGVQNYATQFSTIYGAFGVQPGHFYEKNGKVYAASIMPEYKEAIAYIAKLYDSKVIDPDIFILQNDQALRKLLQGKSGSFTAWWSIPQQVMMDQYKMKEINPKAKWSIIPPIKGKNGQSGIIGMSRISSTASISSNCKNPKTAFQLLDYLFSDEGYWLAAFGIKNVHYTVKDGHFEARTEAGKQGMDGRWLDIMANFLGRTDIGLGTYEITNPDYWPFIEGAKNSKQYFSLFDGFNTPEAQTYLPEVRKVEVEWFIKFVTGKEPISRYDEYVKQWKDKGGKLMMDSYVREYNIRKKAKLTAGN